MAMSNGGSMLNADWSDPPLRPARGFCYHRGMQTERRQFGDRGEDLAARYLFERGFRIVARQVRVGRMGEIDLVAEDYDTLVFIEVKTRRDARYGTPEEALSWGKRRRLANAVMGYIGQRNLHHVRYRVDVVAVDLTQGEPVVRHLRNVTL